MSIYWSGRGVGRAGSDLPGDAGPGRITAGGMQTRFINSVRINAHALFEFDKIDAELLRELTKDGAASVPELAKKMNANSSVLYSRIRRMKEKKLIKRFTIDVDESMLGVGVRATIGINRDSKNKDAVHASLLAIPEISAISEVTGRFDILANIRASNLEDLHTTATSKIGKIAGVQSTETFIELQKKSKPAPYLVKKTMPVR